MYQLLQTFYSFYLQNMVFSNETQERLSRNHRLFMRGLMEMNPNKLFYPNANSMMRLTYGQVKGYEVEDALTARYNTTLEGTIAKYRPGSWEFDLPERIVELFNSKDYGPYADQDGKIRACF